MLQNQPYDQSVDVWAAGILLYIMCAPLFAYPSGRLARLSHENRKCAG